MTETPADGASRQPSIDRAFEVLEALASNGGQLSLSEIATAMGLSVPSVHRLLQTLVRLGYVRQGTSGRYALAPSLIRLGDGAAKQIGTWANPVLADLVDLIGESANMAILEGTHALYVAQVAGRHALRMFTEVGRRVPVHSTGVGKALLSQLSDDKAARLLTVAGLPTITEHTITDVPTLIEELAAGRAIGYTTDNSEHEIGVSCVAVPVPEAPALTAISVSAPTPRMTPDLRRRAATALKAAARTMTARFTAADLSFD